MSTATISALIARALSGDEDDEGAWHAIRELHQRGAEAFDAAARLMRSNVAHERMRGADILGQLRGEGDPAPLKARCAEALLDAIPDETDPAVLNSVGVALGHLRDPRGAAAMLPFAQHPDADVRFGALFALAANPVGPALAALISLSADSDTDVRNWSTFQLGSLLEADTPELREALWNRLEDPNDEIAGEALLGLIRRRDSRSVEVLRRRLAEPSVNILVVEAAEELGDRSLLPLLIALRDDPGEADDFFNRVLRQAIEQLQSAAR